MGFRLAIFVLLLLQHIAAADCSVSRSYRSVHAEKAALLAFKSTIISDPEAALANWLASNDVCNFTGIWCDRWRLHVVHLQLIRKSIHGSLSPPLANLTRLRVLDLSENQLTGRIPPELSSLRRLEDIDLSGNQLSGPIPEDLSRLSRIAFLNLGSNRLVGSIPASILANCTCLGVLDLSDNKLSGKIPPDIGNNLPQLFWLSLYLNDLSGEIPLSLSNASKLNTLEVGNNHLSGELPSGVVYSLKGLKTLHLSYNDLRSHGNNSDLRPFFSALSNCSSLRELEMVGNGLAGRLPRAVGRLSARLSIVNMEENRIRGSIPQDIANLCNLTLLNLSSNLLEGTIPEEIGQLPKLERLILSNNLLRGGIPASMGNISSLGLLDLSKNMLTGEIPASLGNLTRVIELLLQKNLLSGAIPSGLGGLRDLNKLDLSYNRLTGEVPREVARVARIFLNLSNNHLHGPLPPELGKMEQVQEIDLSSNNLTGEVSTELSSCIAVKLINLSHNSLRGPLPVSLGDLKNLECLDLSFNSLSGEIPVSLYNCTSLTQLNLSFNDFSGSIPSGGIFSFFTNLSFLGNPHLCGSLSGPVCSGRRSSSSNLHSRTFLISACIIASVLAFALTVACVIAIRKLKGLFFFRKDAMAADAAPALKSSYPRITHRELAEATGDFDQGNLLGSGSYGHVYRGVLHDGTNVAVKVLKLQTSNSTKSFNRECQVLKRIRHRNLMRIITACSVPDFKALVLPFMANGSLEGHLHPSSGLPPRLDLLQRVSICSDVAEGMAYLHHHSPVQVIHCDLKPSNVLLNDDMTALVSDFGISRLTMTAGGGGSVVAADDVGSSTVNMLCGSIGYIAPEYGFGSSASTKGDVYSFGVLVLEIVTARRPTDEMFEGGTSLHRWVASCYPGGRVERVVDASLWTAARDQRGEVKRMWEVALEELLELGLLCTQESPSLRPTMLDAADDLDRLKRYLLGDTTATFVSSFGISSSTFGDD
ncbi:hypothetical protein Taro_046743 [Colocasia esculenta]|uniref:non-specific serine/threonine protein kinase n=1 Tax=Colocasia esculenta TaxID=4460 RepID=A0A843X7L0_COLES|nr:hypothetical protein [Colocasia esculenta]